MLPIQTLPSCIIASSQYQLMHIHDRLHLHLHRHRHHDHLRIRPYPTTYPTASKTPSHFKTLIKHVKHVEHVVKLDARGTFGVRSSKYGRRPCSMLLQGLIKYILNSSPRGLARQAAGRPGHRSLAIMHIKPTWLVNTPTLQLDGIRSIFNHHVHHHHIPSVMMTQ